MASRKIDREARVPLIMGMSMLLACQMLGELISLGLALPVPGPVIGMVILLVALLIRGQVPASLRLTGEGLLRYLTLLFVPAGVGVMVHGALIGADLLPIILTLFGSTAVTLAVTAWVLSYLQRRSGHGVSQEGDE